jgi:hypothetical protein
MPGEGAWFSLLTWARLSPTDGEDGDGAGGSCAGDSWGFPLSEGFSRFSPCWGLGAVVGAVVGAMCVAADGRL